MKIAVAGGTGFIGKAFIAYGASRGHEMLLISRRKTTVTGVERVVTWDEMSVDPLILNGIDAVVNLSGESINQRWTEKAKERIVSSRIQTTTRIAKLVNALPDKPAVVVNGSGMSVYGTSLTDTYEESSPGQVVDFLSAVVKKWEEAADRIQGTRLVKLRIGIVLGTQGGALPKMLLPFRLGVGGPIGSGKQWMSWIHLEDMVRLILFCIENPAVEGPVNATAPEPVTNEQFSREIGAALHRPSLVPVPAVAMRLLFGEMAALLLDGQRVLPGKALEAGFDFCYPTVDAALRDLLQVKDSK